MWKPTHVDVTVIKAKDLVVKGKGSNDVYSIIQLGKERFQTTTREKTASPEWNEECSFEIPSDMSKTIEISLFHRNLLSIDRFLGRIALPIDELFSFQEKPHAQWYALRAKTTKKKAKYRGEILVRTTFVFRSDALGSGTAGGPSQSTTASKGSALTPLGSEFLRKSATNLALSLGGKKSSFREKSSAGSDDKRSSIAIAGEDGSSRQRLNRSHSLAALTVALRRASFGKKSSKKGAADDVPDNVRKQQESDDDDDDDKSESVRSHARVDTDEERDDFSATDVPGPDDSAVMQRKQYSLPHTVGSSSQALPTPGVISRAVSSVSAGAPTGDRFEREGSGRLKASSKGSNHNHSNESQVSSSGVGGGGGGMQRQPSARSSASESGLSIDARSQSSGIGFTPSFGNGTPPKSTPLQHMAGTGNSNHQRSSVAGTAPNHTPNGGGIARFSVNDSSPVPPMKNGGSTGRQQTPMMRNGGGSSDHLSSSGGGGGGIPMPSFSPRPSNGVIPSDVYAQYGRMSREELLQVIARQQLEISRRDEYIDEMLSRVMEKAHWILQKS